MFTLPFRRQRRNSTQRLMVALVLILVLELFLPGTLLFKFAPLPSALANNAQRLAASKVVKGKSIKSNVIITTLGSPITQNFDTLLTSGTANAWADDTTLTGWYSQFSVTPTNPTTYRADSGGSNAGAIYSWGLNPLAERAFGSVASGTPGDIFNAIKLTNNTGQTITSVDVSYTGEQWRQGGCQPTPCTPLAHKLDFQYQVANAGVITDSNSPTTGWVDHDSLDFTSPQPGTSTAAAIDGNAAANRTALSSNISVTVAAGQEIWLRWKDINDANNDHGLGIDDFSVTANGGPVTPTLNIGDVAQAEGNAGTTTFNFNVSLTSAAGAGGVSFTINTQDGTTNPANAGSDYVAIVAGAGSITSGNTSTTVSVTVNGDTTPEPNETFFVNLSGITNANAGDVQGLGTINNDDVTLIPIHDIQGNGSSSPFAAQFVTTSGIVTGLKSNGFFIQEPDASVDADANTSEGIFVFTSSTPPAAAALGNSVQVTGMVSEFIPPADPSSPPLTELTGPTVSLLSTGNPLPAAITITAGETTQASETPNTLDTLEEFEGMRVTVASLTTIAPTQGTITESSATASSNGVFYGVVTGVARPFREPGVAISDPLPAGAPANVPRFDENPERLRVDSDAQPGTTLINVTAGTVLTGVTGPLDFGFRTYTILPDAATPPGVGSIATFTAVPAQNPNELTVGTFNMQRFYNDVDDPGGDVVLTTTAFNNRLNKASLAIRNVMRNPDVIGIVEMENLTTLQAVATKVNNDTVSGGGANPNYQAFLSEGNDPGLIDVGFLVKTSRVSVVDVTQFGLTTTYINPNNGSPETLNDRPPLVLRGTIPKPAGGIQAFTVIVNHLRSLNGVDDPTPSGSGTEGARVRAKRRAQAEFLANLIQSRQTNDPTEVIISVGDYNAFQFNDGYVDGMGTITGNPTPPDQVVLASSDLVNPDLTNLINTVPPDQRYSFTFDGSAQSLDHVLVNDDALALLTRFAYGRNNADFPQSYFGDPARPERISDHDMPVAYFSLGGISAGSVIISEFRFRGPAGAAPDGSLDEYTELYNNTDSAIIVNSADGTSGWSLAYLDSLGAQTIAAVIPNGTVIPARGHYLIVNEPVALGGKQKAPRTFAAGEYTLDDYAEGDQRYHVLGPGTHNIPDNGAIAIFQTSNPSNFSLSTRLDAVSLSSAAGATADLYREGTNLPSHGPNDGQYAYVRKLVTGVPQDTNNNANDFAFVSTNAGSYGGVQSQLGAPGPENTQSPIQRNLTIKATLIEPLNSSSAEPNRVRDLTAVTNGAQGTLSIRRRFVNTKGHPVTRLRFRVVDITTLNSPGYTLGGPQADIRAIDGSNFNITTSRGMLNVLGTTVEQPAPLSQPTGGGLNTSLTVVIPGGVLPNGASIDLHFLLGVQQVGSYRVFVNVEALP